MESEFKGDLTFKGSFRIEGTFKGTINSDSLLVIGERGKVEADVKVGQLVIEKEFLEKKCGELGIDLNERP